MKYDLNLRPIHYASVSFNKDSIYMLKVIAENPQKYPLDLVAYFDLEIAWEWEKKIANDFEERFKKAGVKFVRIKPRKTFKELYERYDMPTRRCRWCNSDYKLDCKKQLEQWILEQNCRPVAYIGFCADEQKRFKYELGNWEQQDCCYPLAEEGITEDIIHEWAKKQPMFDGWYEHFERAGCMYCPMLTRKEIAYMYEHYPIRYLEYMRMIREYDEKYNTQFFNEPVDRVARRIETKWVDILRDEEHYKQLSMFEEYKQ